MSPSKRRVLLPIALTCCASLGAGAGVVYESETTRQAAGKTITESATTSIQGSLLKMEVLSNQDPNRAASRDEVIFRGDTRQMTMVNHREESYMVIDEATIRQFGGQMSAAMKEAEKQLQGLDPKQREMIEQMMKGNMPGTTGSSAPSRPPIEVRRTSEKATHSGYPCVRYDLVRGDQKLQELWVTDWSNIKGGTEAAALFGQLAELFTEMMESFTSMAGSLPVGDLFTDSPLASFTEIDGFPVLTRVFKGGELDSETILRSATERALDPDAFEPPKGYRPRAMGPQ